MKEVPDLKGSIVRSLHLWIPILVLIALCCLKFSPFLSASACTLFILISTIVYERSLKLLKKIFLILEACALAMISIIGIMGCAAIIVGITNHTGLMIKSTSIILSLSSGNIIITALILLVVSYFMGMGLPVTSCYVILSALGVSALIKSGATPIGAHLMLFWSTMVAGITPPVCVSAFVAANVAEADAMKTGFASLKMGLMFFLIPITFLFSNILTGSIIEISTIFCILLLGIYHLVVAIEGVFLRKINIIYRLVSLIIFSLASASIYNAFEIKTRAILAFSAALIAFSSYVLQKQNREYCI
jgi:TRAP-type uncharacterized transport system fused permease subunit